MSEHLPANQSKILFIDDEVFFANGYLDELDKHYVTEVARNIFDAENELSGPNLYSCVVLDVMMPIPENWPDSDRDDALYGTKTGIILLRRYKQLFIEKKLPVLILTNRQKQEIEAEVAKLGFPSPLVEVYHKLLVVYHKLETPSFALPHIVRDLIARNESGDAKTPSGLRIGTEDNDIKKPLAAIITEEAFKLFEENGRHVNSPHPNAAILSKNKVKPPEGNGPVVKSPSNAPSQSKKSGLLPIGSKPMNAAGHVIFIHGLMGDGIETWKHENGHFWPQELASIFPDLAFWTLDYHAEMSRWQNDAMSISDRSTWFLDTLCNHHLLENDAPLIFVTHSMGGLIVKEALNHSDTKREDRFQRIARNTRGIAFLAVPHGGSKLADIVNWFASVLRLNPQLKDLAKQCDYLRDLHAWFLAWLADNKKCKCRSWVEKKAVTNNIPLLNIPVGTIIVDRDSGNPGIPKQTPVPVDEDHISISKPENDESPIFKGIQAFIRECTSRPKSK